LYRSPPRSGKRAAADTVNPIHRNVSTPMVVVVLLPLLAVGVGRAVAGISGRLPVQLQHSQPGKTVRCLPPLLQLPSAVAGY